jgi:hypothetical protein
MAAVAAPWVVVTEHEVQMRLDVGRVERAAPGGFRIDGIRPAGNHIDGCAGKASEEDAFS